MYPLDTLKTRFQSPDYKKIYYNASQTAINKPLLFRGLYQGVGSVILITIPSCELSFFVRIRFRANGPGSTSGHGLQVTLEWSSTYSVETLRISPDNMVSIAINLVPTHYLIFLVHFQGEY